MFTLLLIPPVSAVSEIISVCERGCDHHSINAAIDAASDGDVIQLAAETYFEGVAVDPRGKAVTIRGSTDSSGEPNSILDGDTGHQVISCRSGETEGTVFQDLIIQHGSAGGGGGMGNIGSSPTLVNCRFRNNHAHDYGGGMLVYAGGPSLVDCTFEENSTTFAGGAMYIDNSDCRITRCTFRRNTTPGRGGGVANLGDGDSTLDHCRFEDNTALEGGGIYNYSSRPILTACLFTGNAFMINSGGDFGGGMYNHNSDPMLIDCTFRGNYGVEYGGGLFNYLSAPILDGCLITDNLTSGLGGGIASFEGQPILIDSRVCSNGPDQIFGGFQDLGGNHVGPRCPPPSCLTDLDRDGLTSGSDLGILFTAWGACDSCLADLNHDDQVDGADLGLLFLNWGPCL